MAQRTGQQLSLPHFERSLLSEGGRATVSTNLLSQCVCVGWGPNNKNGTGLFCYSKCWPAVEWKTLSINLFASNTASEISLDNILRACILNHHQEFGLIF